MYANYVKRILDLTLSLIAVILCSPIFLILFLLVRFKLGSPGPVYTRNVLGRTKDLQALQVSHHGFTDRSTGRTAADEIRLTSFGKKLRATSLDELPESLNILKGDMSIVGPDHCWSSICRFITKNSAIGICRPGLTGQAQVHGRNAISWEKEIQA
ncbi:MAG: sugar transferase [Merdibacter sp.]